MIAELEALVAVAEVGSMERAAKGLYLTPSALTRRIQRLESELGIVLLDRHFKPPKLTLAGREILDKSRPILSSLEELRGSGDETTASAGPFRLGLSHALAQPDVSKIIIDLGQQFPRVEPNISSDVSPRLLDRLHTGDLEMAVVLLPRGAALPHDLAGVTISQEAFHLVQARSRVRPKASKQPDVLRCSWVLNPAGCLVREEVRNWVESAGGSLKIAAELHNPELQLALVAGNVGVGVVQERVLARHPLRSQVSIVKHPAFPVLARVIAVRGRHLGRRKGIALELERILVRHFGVRHFAEAGKGRGGLG